MVSEWVYRNQMLVTVPVLALLVGFATFVFSGNPKAVELGKICFFCGLLVTLFYLAHVRI